MIPATINIVVHNNVIKKISIVDIDEKYKQLVEEEFMLFEHVKSFCKTNIKDITLSNTHKYEQEIVKLKSIITQNEKIYSKKIDKYQQEVDSLKATIDKIFAIVS